MLLMMPSVTDWKRLDRYSYAPVREHARGATMEYKLWNIESGHYIGKYTDEDAAFATVGSLVAEYGDDYAKTLSLGRIADDGSVLPPLAGAELRAHVSEAAERRRLASTVRRP